MAVNKRLFAISYVPIGYQPRSRRTSNLEVWACVVMMQIVVTEHSATEMETKRMRARMTVGASRDKTGEGRVVGER